MLVEIERLVKSGTVNGNNVFLETESFNKAIDRYLRDNGALRKNTITIEQRNELIKSNKLYPSIFDIIGQVMTYDDEKIYVKLLTEIDSIDGYACEFFVDGTKMSSTEDYEIYKVSNVKAIILVKK